MVQEANEEGQPLHQAPAAQAPAPAQPTQQEGAPAVPAPAAQVPAPAQPAQQAGAPAAAPAAQQPAPQAQPAAPIYPIHAAVQAGALARLLKLLGNGGAVNSQDDRLDTPLHIAVRLGNTGIMRNLLDHDAEVITQNGQGDTVLHIAAEKNYSRITELLLEKIPANRIKDVNIQNVAGNTALHVAAYHGHAGIIVLLRDFGASVNLGNSAKPSQTAYEVARARNQQSAMELLRPVSMLSRAGTAIYMVGTPVALVTARVGQTTLKGVEAAVEKRISEDPRIVRAADKITDRVLGKVFGPAELPQPRNSCWFL
jgi:hypothetical protein